MSLSRVPVLFALLLTAAACQATTLSGQPCAQSAALNTYLQPSASFPNGCDVGPLNYQFLEFAKLTPREGGGYSFNSEGGTITPNNLFVVPTVSGPSVGVTFRSDAFQSDFSQAGELYYLSYTIDPPPILVGEDLGIVNEANFARLANPFAFSGDVLVSQYLCVDGFFARNLSGPGTANNQCAGGGTETDDPLFQQVGLDHPFSHIQFPEPARLVSVHLFISLTGDLRDSGFVGVRDTTVTDTVTGVVPEPFTGGLAFIGLGILGVGRKLSARR